MIFLEMTVAIKVDLSSAKPIRHASVMSDFAASCASVLPQTSMPAIKQNME